MRSYGSVHKSFWEDACIQRLSDQAKLLAVYLQTGPHSNMLGCLRLPDGYITEDLGWSNQTVKLAFQQLTEMQFLTRDPQLFWLVVHDFLKWNPIQNPRQGIGIRKIFNSVPSQSTVLKPLVNGLLIYGKYFEKGFLDDLNSYSHSLETLSEDCVADQEQNQDQDQEQDQDKLLMSGKPDMDIPKKLISFSDNQSHHSYKTQAVEILDFLNSKVSRAYRPVDTNLKLIMARLKSGATLIQCRQVIAKKAREWKGNPKMCQYLRPATLFNAEKFEQYLGELVLPQEEFQHEVN